MKNILIILPNQQFQTINTYIDKYEIDEIFIYEEEYLFNNQHQFKIIFILETLYNYYTNLKKTFNININYINDLKNISKHNNIFMFNPLNYILIKQYNSLFYNIEYINYH
jgi:hypothetical protein